ncbi:MAG TPA: S8 family serine peptidase [Vicinamibacterales bacterium]|nr:S8 family serine peptidase [Vicinamibacterales bacterium]
MTGVELSVGALAGRTGRGVRVAVVDSGIHAAHPHVRGIAGGVAVGDDGPVSLDVVDRLGHGTAVAAAIREKAPDASIIAVKVFDRSLRTSARALAAAIRWAAAQRAALINLSLGTTNPDHEGMLAGAVSDAAARGAIVIAAAPEGENVWLPGALPGVVGVELDWTCARDACLVRTRPDGTVRIAASGFPRPIPGVSPEQNLQGLSFAVANATGLIAVALEGHAAGSTAELLERLGAVSSRTE